MAKRNQVFDNDLEATLYDIVQQHTNLTMKECAANLGVGRSTLSRWISESKKSENGSVEMRGTGNFESDEAKEIARLRRELRDTKDALEILKKAIGILGD